MSFSRDIKGWLGGMYGPLILLILINVVVFLTLNIYLNIAEVSGSSNAFDSLSNLIDLPSNFSVLATRFWTPFTYMFVHYGLGHIFSNMLWLYFLGRVYCELLGKSRITLTYIIGGIAGALFYLVFYNLLPHKIDAELKGASAGVMAVIVTVAAYSPDYMLHMRFIIVNFSIRLKWIALIAFLLTSVIDFSGNMGGKLSHIGGAIFGIIYGTQLRHGKNFMESFSNLFKRKNKNLRVEHSRSRHVDDEAYNSNKLSVRKQVDEILDKISRSGYDSLSKEEKNFLQKNHDKF